MKQFFLNNWRWFAVVGGGFFLLFFGYGMGRYVQPAKVVVTEKVKEVVQERVVVQEKVKIEKVVVRDERQKIHREITEEKRPDGVEIKKTSEDINVDTVVHENEVQVKFVDRWQDRIVEKIVEKEKLVIAKKPDWRVGAGVGLSVPYFLGQSEIGVPGMKGSVVEAHVGRRILGPVFINLRGNTQGTVTLGVEGEF